ncbi:hypothetical protein GCM10022243_56350 [Saccharothrix violaceirubra]|uniref:Capsular polysaccharide biosynthesis protein n=1 Tax=Saccharothrix violaceirubra TaxID=413306 RepID=A0A7W7T5V6_9PSEU|nr:hypothetical protein [Saccharothrix violaceirubra]MBB4967147.1 hypothetical protein [Saccharothrix violaceirubra]
MDFWGAVRTLRRRWYIAVPAAVVAVAVAAGVFLSIPTRYASSGVMVLTTPAAGGTFSQKVSPEEAVRINPLLAFDGSLATTSQILAQILADPKTREEGLGLGKNATDTYVATGGGQNGPFLFVSGESDTPEAAEKMVSTVMEFAQKRLKLQQEELKAPEPTFITSQIIVNPTEAEAKIGGKVRYAGAAFVLLLLLTTAVTFGADSILNNIKRKRERAERGDVDDDERPEDEERPDPQPRPTPGPQQQAPQQQAPQQQAPQQQAPQQPGPQQQGQQQHGQAPNGTPGGQRRPLPPAAPPRLPTASEQTVKVDAKSLNLPSSPLEGRPPAGGQSGQVHGGPAQNGGQQNGGQQNGAKPQPGPREPNKPQPTASERTVKIAAPRSNPTPGRPAGDDRA